MVRDFLEGQNQLLFTYGATSAGKTYTIQGVPGDSGIMPRAVDVIFNTVGDRMVIFYDIVTNMNLSKKLT